ncbi:Toll/interleukin-1 receptor domain-containing protein [Tanacetum coccineum]
MIAVIPSELLPSILLLDDPSCHFWEWSTIVSKSPLMLVQVSCQELALISSSCLAVLDGGQYLWIKAFLRRSQKSMVPGGSLSTHLLAAPIKVIGKTRNMTASCDTPGMLNKLTMSKTQSTCSWASSFLFLEKVLEQAFRVLAALEVRVGRLQTNQDANVDSDKAQYGTLKGDQWIALNSEHINGGLRARFLEVAQIIRHRETLLKFDDVRSIILLEESEMLSQANAMSSFNSSSSLPSVLVVTSTGPTQPKTMRESGLDYCRNFQRGTCTYGLRFKFVHGIHDNRPIPTSQPTGNSTKGNTHISGHPRGP